MKQLIVLAAACISALGLTIRCNAEDDSASVSKKLPDSVFQNRLWLSGLPTGEDPAEVIDAVAFISPGSGVWVRGSQFMSYQELFFYKAGDDGEYEAHFPHRDEDKDLDVDAYECDEEPFELCAVIDTDAFGGKQVFYSMWEFEIDSATISELQRDSIPIFWPRYLAAMSVAGFDSRLRKVR